MKQLRHIILFSILICMSSCNGQPLNSEPENHKSDWRLDPYSPSLDTLKSWCTISSDILKRVQKNDSLNCDHYYVDDSLFSGWACVEIVDNKHKFRFEQFENGVMIRRIGFYDNRRLDYDFRMKDCQNYGPSRMWLYEDGMYIDEYYSEPGVKHGLHKRWHDNGTLAREAKYGNGMLLYEKEYDRSGKLTNEK